MFAPGLYSLTPRDVVGAPLEIIHRTASYASAVNTLTTASMLDVPLGKLFQLTSFNMRAVPPLGAAIIQCFAVIQGLTANPPPRLCSYQMNESLAGTVELHFGWQGSVIFPGPCSISLGHIQLPGGATLFDFSLAGVQFPLGTVQSRG